MNEIPDELVICMHEIRVHMQLHTGKIDVPCTTK